MPAPYGKDLQWREKLPTLPYGLGLWDVFFFLTSFEIAVYGKANWSKMANIWDEHQCATHICKTTWIMALFVFTESF